MNEKELFQGIASKDNRTFNYMYKNFLPAIRTLVIKNSGDEEEALDVFQEGIISIWTNIQKGKFELQDDTKISTYLYTICRNQWISKIRKNKKLVQINESDEQQLVELETEYEEENERMKRMRLNVEKLGEECRKLLYEFYYEKKSLKDIAADYAISEKSAKNKKYRCMQRLRNFFEA